MSETNNIVLITTSDGLIFDTKEGRRITYNEELHGFEVSQYGMSGPCSRGVIEKTFVPYLHVTSIEYAPMGDADFLLDKPLQGI
jgi:hypothetical protein